MAKAWTVPGLAPDARFADAAGRVIATRWREMMSYADETLAGTDIEALHAMRVSSRRLRAAMDAFASVFPARSFTRHLSQVKAITDTLGAARDLDVAIDRLTGLMPSLTPLERPGVTALAEDYRVRRHAETARIAALFARLRESNFDARFERWLRRHTGIDAGRLGVRAPDA